MQTKASSQRAEMDIELSTPQFWSAWPEMHRRGGRMPTLLLALAVAIGIGVWSHLTRRSPANAQANEVVAPDAAAPTLFFSDCASDLRDARGALAQTQLLVEPLAGYPVLHQMPLECLRTNPFHRTTAYPSSAANPGQPLTPGQQHDAILRAVQLLQLQSILPGQTQRACILNNVMYRQGQEVEHFIIERIDADAVIIRGGPYRFELRIQR